MTYTQIDTRTPVHVIQIPSFDKCYSCNVGLEVLWLYADEGFMKRFTKEDENDRKAKLILQKYYVDEFILAI